MTTPNAVPSDGGAPEEMVVIEEMRAYSPRVAAPDPTDLVAVQVFNANRLLQWAAENGRPVEQRVSAPITNTLRFLQGGAAPKPHEWDAFTRAYSELTQSTGGVTVRTLHATSDADGSVGGAWIRTFISREPISAARRWTYSLWRFTIIVALVTVAAEFYEKVLNRFYALDENSTTTAIAFHIVN